MFILHMRLFFFLLTRLPPRSTLFPYTTLFRSWLLKNVNKIRLPLGQIQVFFQQKPILFYSYEAFFLPSGTHHQMTAVPNIADPAATHLNMGWARRSMDRPIITQVRSMA